MIVIQLHNDEEINFYFLQRQKACCIKMLRNVMPDVLRQFTVASFVCWIHAACSLLSRLCSVSLHHRQHGSAALWQVPHAKSMGKSELWPNDIKIPEIFQIWTWCPWLRPRDYTSTNFNLNPFSGASPQIGEMLRFCDLFLVILYFFLRHGLWLIRRIFAQVCPFWRCDNIGIHLGKQPPKTPPKGVWISSQTGWI